MPLQAASSSVADSTVTDGSAADANRLIWFFTEWRLSWDMESALLSVHSRASKMAPSTRGIGQRTISEDGNVEQEMGDSVGARRRRGSHDAGACHGCTAAQCQAGTVGSRHASPGQ